MELLDSFDELDSFEELLSFAPPESLELESFVDESFVDDEPGSEDVELGPLVEDVDDLESVTYQPLPLNTMPTGWMILRSVPPHSSQVVSGGSVKLWRFSTWLLQLVQV